MARPPWQGVREKYLIAKGVRSPKSLGTADLEKGMDIVNLTETEMVKDLGVWIDKDLNWSQKCRKSASN